MIISDKGINIDIYPLKKFPDDEYRNLMKVMVFVVDNLYSKNDKGVDNFISNNDLVKLYVSWNEMYILSRSEEFSESDLEKFEVSK